MEATVARPIASPSARTAGRLLSALALTFLTFDGLAKVLRAQPAVEGTSELGFSPETVVPLGVILLGCVLLHLLPRTALLGAVLLTAYLGGAVATHVRLGNPLFSHVLFPVYVAVFVWTGLYLRDRRVRALLRPLAAGAPPMSSVTSKDGTRIAYERLGNGPPLILVDGALCSREFGPMPKLAPLLAKPSFGTSETEDCHALHPAAQDERPLRGRRRPLRRSGPRGGQVDGRIAPARCAGRRRRPAPHLGGRAGLCGCRSARTVRRRRQGPRRLRRLPRHHPRGRRRAGEGAGGRDRRGGGGRPTRHRGLGHRHGPPAGAGHLASLPRALQRRGDAVGGAGGRAPGAVGKGAEGGAVPPASGCARSTPPRRRPSSMSRSRRPRS